LLAAAGNNRSCVLDCTAALALAPANIKAYYRLSQALLALRRLSAARQTCETGLALDPSNLALQGTLAKIQKQAAAQAAVEAKRAEQAARERAEAALLAAALRQRGIRMRQTEQPPEMEDAAVRLIGERLVFPVVVLYPLHLQSDFVKAFGEEEALTGHLAYLLPLPWDRDGAYVATDVEAYAEGVGGGLVKWGKKVPLGRLLEGGKVEVVDGLVKVNVVPKARAAEWIEQVRARKRGA
jgi:tetratricopeptide (TPR) repeat protein